MPSSPLPSSCGQISALFQGRENRNGRLGDKEPNCLLLLYGLVGGNPAVTEVNDTMRVLRNVMFVGHQDDGVPLPMQVLEEPHDLFAVLRIQVSCRLVRQHDGR